MRRTTMVGLVMAAVCLWGRPADGQVVHPCDTNATGPFIVQSARAFTVQWCTALVRTDPNDPTLTIPERVDGHYIQLDNGAKTDVAATDLGISTVTNRRGWQYLWPAGVARGDHVLAVSSWNYALDASGNPTTTRQEGPAVSAPFTAADPISTLPPLAPTGIRVIR